MLVRDDHSTGDGNARHFAEAAPSYGSGSQQDNSPRERPAPSSSSSSSPPPPMASLRAYYQRTHPFDARCCASSKLRGRYPGAIPIIFEPGQYTLVEGTSAASTAFSSSSASSAQRSEGGRAAALYALWASWRGSYHGRQDDRSDAFRSAPSTTRSQDDCSAAAAAGRPLTHQCVPFKFVMPPTKTLAEAMLTLRTRLMLAPSQAIFLLVGDDVMAPSNSKLGDLYERYRDADGFLYITYTLENTFGGG